MAATPKPTVEDVYAEGLTCAICGEQDLYVQHLPKFPDFVTCRNCQAAFVVEDSGERVMYGKIPDAYPETKAFAFRQWVWLEAVDRHAREEHPRAVPAPPPNPPQEPRDQLVEAPTPPPAAAKPAAPAGPDADWLAARLRTADMPAGVPIPTEPDPYRSSSAAVPLGSDTSPKDDSLPAWLRGEAPADSPPPAPPPAAPQPVIPDRPKATPAVAAAAPAMAAAEEAPTREGEPPADQRVRVTIRGDRVRMPVVACAHCQRSPAPDRLPVAGSLPRSGGGRRSTTFQVPLCRECGTRTKARSSEERGARLMAHLTGALVGLILVVVVLAANVIPFATNLALGLAVLVAIGLAGYGLTAAFMLGRAGRMPRPPDAAFVRSTLRVVADPAAPLTAFEWRNADFAASFHKANSATAVAPPASVADSPPSP
jgi:hypothetical protein